MPGILYIVSTPIGNLKDITFRAVEVLKGADLIAAEDTRHTKILTSHYGIETPLTSYFQHNSIRKADLLIRLLKEGKDIALVSDAGTPGISDPGFVIIKKALEEGIEVVPIPGPAAFLTALSVSGLPTNKFAFEGFLSNKSSQRKNRLKELAAEDRTVILYESPHRLLAALKDILEVFGDIDIVLSRELTKKFEEIRREKVTRCIEHFSNTKILGEFIIMFHRYIKQGVGSVRSEAQPPRRGLRQCGAKRSLPEGDQISAERSAASPEGTTSPVGEVESREKENPNSLFREPRTDNREPNTA